MDWNDLMKRSVRANLWRVSVQDWMARGEVKPFRELSPEQQKAIAHYMAFDGEAWDFYDDLYEEPQGDLPEWEKFRASAPDYLNRAMPRYIEQYGDTPFGVTNVPMADLTSEVVRSSHDIQADHGDWDRYHQWYTGAGTMPDHDVTQPLWPVILDRDHAEPIQDGWHRLHDYYRKGVQDVPAVFYPKEQAPNG